MCIHGEAALARAVPGEFFLTHLRCDCFVFGLFGDWLVVVLALVKLGKLYEFWFSKRHFFALIDKPLNFLQTSIRAVLFILFVVVNLL